jgi:hypothetical protein
VTAGSDGTAGTAGGNHREDSMGLNACAKEALTSRKITKAGIARARTVEEAILPENSIVIVARLRPGIGEPPDGKITSTFKRIYHIRDGRTHEAAGDGRRVT